MSNETNENKKTLSAEELNKAYEKLYEQCPKLRPDPIAGWRLDEAIDRWKEEERWEEMNDQRW